MTDIMGPLSKLWVMIKNVKKANVGNAPAVQMGMVLDLLKKKVVFVGQCMNTITYERCKNVLLGVAGTFATDITALLKKRHHKHETSLVREGIYR